MSIRNEFPPLAKLEPGDTVTVVVSSAYRHMEARHHLARVVKAARVWVELVEVPESPTAYPLTWRMRMDSQDEGLIYPYGAYFRTREQLEYEERMKAAWAVVGEYFEARNDRRVPADMIFAVADALTALKTQDQA